MRIDFGSPGRSSTATRSSRRNLRAWVSPFPGFLFKLDLFDRSEKQMRIFLTGVSCVGKTTIGRRLAELSNRRFYDLDAEIERFFGQSIEQLQQRFLMPHDFRKEAAKALVHTLDKPESRRAVIALPPSGLMGGYLAVLKKTRGLKIALMDTPENILNRIVFYDVESKPLDKRLSVDERPLYLKEIKKDIAYFKPSYARADLRIGIEGLDAEQAARHLLAQLQTGAG